MDLTLPNEQGEPKGAREWMERTPTNPRPTDRTGMDRTPQTNPKNPWAHVNGPNEHERTLRSPGRTGMNDRTHTQ